MARKNLSWSRIKGIENLIGRKKVDLSTFKYGMTIPKEYHDDFLEGFPNNSIDESKGYEITLEIDDIIFHAKIRNVNRTGYKGDTIQIRYDSNKELMDYLKEKFIVSFEYIETHYNINGKNNKVEVLEGFEEYIEFYKTDKIGHYRLKLITKLEKDNNLKEEFFKYIGPKGILNNSKYQKSYKLMLLLHMFNLADEEGKADYDQVCENICQMYLDKNRIGLRAEKFDSRIQKEIDILDKNIVKSVMNENGYKVIHEKGYIDKKDIDDVEYAYFDKKLWEVLDKEDVKNLKEILEDKLEIYYKERVDEGMSNFTLKAYFEKIIEGYVRAREKEAFAGHELGEIFRKIIPSYLESLPFIKKEAYQITGSIGQGNWAKVPWIALMNKKSTTSTQRGIYIVYLFSERMDKIYLTLMQGVTDIRNEYGRIDAKNILIEKGEKIREKLDIKEHELINDIHVSNGNLGEMYEAGTVLSIKYDKDNIPDDQKLIEDLKSMIVYYERYLNEKDNQTITKVHPKYTQKEMIDYIYRYINSKGFYYDIDIIKNFYLSLKTKPFVLLAGISGTGKSKLVELFAQALGATSENGGYTIIPVRPDWSDPCDLLGYKNIEGKFQPSSFINIIKNAVEDKMKRPYFVCLDEMNLARVEYYFSDVLSIMETRKRNDGIKTNILLKDEIFGDDEDSREKFSNLYIPENLYIIGTVNMDETTFSFSKKVLDRANTIEFNHVDLSLGIDVLEEIEEIEEIEPIFIDNNTLCSKYIQLKDCLYYKETIKEIIDILEKINEILEEVGLHFGYRVRDEVVFYVLYATQENLMKFNIAIDYAIMQKILPRVQGSHLRIKEILIKLYQYLSEDNRKEYDIYNQDNGEKMYKYLINNEGKYPLSSKKIAKMMRRYESDGFTTFWE